VNSSACGNSAFPRILSAGRHPSHWIGGYHTHRNLGPLARVVFLGEAAVHLEAAAVLEVGAKGKKWVTDTYHLHNQIQSPIWLDDNVRGYEFVNVIR